MANKNREMTNTSDQGMPGATTDPQGPAPTATSPAVSRKVAVIGAGYVGRSAAAVWASFGHHVTCAENDHDKLNMLVRSVSPIAEPGLK